MKKVENYKVDSDAKAGACCPECGANWDGGDIYEHFLAAKFNPYHKQHDHYKNRSLDEIKEAAGSYGWTEETPRRFSEVIGIDMSMDPNATEDEQYDGISYWQCPECKIAWNRFTGDRTEKFLPKEKMVALKELLPEQPMVDEEEDMNRQCVFRSLTTPDGTVLVSHHRHDYVTHVDANGETYMLDGGPDKFYRTSVNNVKGKITEVYLDEGHEKIRDYVHRGGRGKDGTQPLKWVPVSQMNDNWVEATITYNEDRGMGFGWFNKVLKDELAYRKEHGIVIPEEEEV